MSAARTAKTTKTPKAVRTAKPAKAAKASKAGKAPKTLAVPAADETRLMTVLLAPVVSEKATFVADKHNQVIFRVRQDATKTDVKAAVELMWKDKKVEVAKVQMVNVRGKAKRFGAYPGSRRNWKKAYVSLKAGQEINFAQEA